MSRTIITNGKLILLDEIWDDAYVILEDKIIVEVGKGKNTEGIFDNIIDAQQNYISPGFIDIHTHGAGGHDFMDATVEAYLKIAETHAKYGTTALLPTTLASTKEELFYSFEIYRQANQLNINGAKFLGFHIEGPYFAYNQRGAQDPQYLRNPVPEEYMEILNASDDIVRWSIAPELEGALALGELLVSKGILPSIAHTDATCEEVMCAYKSGFTLMTHLYSAMSTITRKNAYRYAGALEAAYLIDDMDVEIIADGVHLPKSLLQYVCKFKNVNRIALVTDSMRGAGMPDCIYKLGSLTNGQDVIVEDGVAKLKDRSAFAGSVATTDRLIRTMTQIAGISLVDAIKMMTYNPARMLKINHEKGSIAVGKDADILIFDDQIEIKMTMVEGKIIYNI
jgi:N-acetylglucosamine-6-phosphate deacetylase